MPLLDPDVLEDIIHKIINDGDSEDLTKFVLAGRQLTAAIFTYFSRVKSVEISHGFIWTKSRNGKEDWIRFNFPFLKTVLEIMAESAEEFIVKEDLIKSEKLFILDILITRKLKHISYRIRLPETYYLMFKEMPLLQGIELSPISEFFKYDEMWPEWCQKLILSKSKFFEIIGSKFYHITFPHVKDLIMDAIIEPMYLQPSKIEMFCNTVSKTFTNLHKIDAKFSLTPKKFFKNFQIFHYLSSFDKQVVGSLPSHLEGRLCFYMPVCGVAWREVYASTFGDSGVKIIEEENLVKKRIQMFEKFYVEIEVFICDGSDH